MDTPRNSMEPPWNSMEAPWNSMELHGTPWNSMDLHGIPWNSMEFHGIPWNSMGLFYTGSTANCLVLHQVTSHGFSDALIEDLVGYCAEIFTLSDVLEKLPVFSIAHAKAILEILDEVFDDVRDCQELLTMVDDVYQTETREQLLWDEEIYFDSSDSDSDDPDRILTEELENLNC